MHALEGYSSYLQHGLPELGRLRHEVEDHAQGHGGLHHLTTRTPTMNPFGPVSTSPVTLTYHHGPGTHSRIC